MLKLWHCRITVRLGELDFNEAIIDGSKTLDVSIKRIISNANYDPSTITNDIALLVLNENVPFTGMPNKYIYEFNILVLILIITGVYNDTYFYHGVYMNFNIL